MQAKNNNQLILLSIFVGDTATAAAAIHTCNGQPVMPVFGHARKTIKNGGIQGREIIWGEIVYAAAVKLYSVVHSLASVARDENATHGRTALPTEQLDRQVPPGHPRAPQA